tara:strand:- start:887 stop:1462 length:576 start_codon:yes stop_codon:yes gene_type:complete
MGLVLVTAPSVEPISTAEAKSHARIEGTAEDTLIGELIVAARQYCEDVQRRAYVTQTWDLILDDFPPDGFRIPLPPLQSVSYVRYTDSDGTVATASTSVYLTDLNNEPGRISLKYSQVWPTVILQPMNGVTIRFVAGEGDSGGSVNEIHRSAVKVMTAHLYENREVLSETTFSEIPLGLKALLGARRQILL